MLLSMCLSIAFIIVDLLSVVNVFTDSLPTGIEPFWKVLPLLSPPFLSPRFTPSISIPFTLHFVTLILIQEPLSSSCPSSSNVSATQSSSTTSKQPWTACATTGYASRLMARYCLPILAGAHRDEMLLPVKISKRLLGRSLRIGMCAVINLSLCQGLCSRRMYKLF